MITLKLTDSIDVIERNINKSIAKIANEKINKNQAKLLSRIKQLAGSWIISQPEILSLSSSSPESLSGQFGIPSGLIQSIIYAIINALKNSISSKFIPYNDKLSGGIEIYFQPKNFINLLSLPEGHIIYNGGDLHWLDWLLKRGDNIIVANYRYNPQSGIGRSGLGIMIPGNSFRVPPQFSGTEDDNFITRALIGPQQEKQISTLLQEALQ
jgi:hypothetical protein